jgi:hypothetical protein
LERKRTLQLQEEGHEDSCHLGGSIGDLDIIGAGSGRAGFAAG